MIPTVTTIISTFFQYYQAGADPYANPGTLLGNFSPVGTGANSPTPTDLKAIAESTTHRIAFLACKCHPSFSSEPIPTSRPSMRCCGITTTIKCGSRRRSYGKSVPIPYELVAPLIHAQDYGTFTWQGIWSKQIAPVVLGDAQKVT